MIPLVLFVNISFSYFPPSEGRKDARATFPPSFAALRLIIAPLGLVKNVKCC